MTAVVTVGPVLIQSTLSLSFLGGCGRARRPETFRWRAPEANYSSWPQGRAGRPAGWRWRPGGSGTDGRGVSAGRVGGAHCQTRTQPAPAGAAEMPANQQRPLEDGTLMKLSSDSGRLKPMRYVTTYSLRLTNPACRTV